MCFSRTPGMLSGPGALWLGRRRSASWKIAGVRCPIIMLLLAGGLLGIVFCQGNGCSGLILSSGERAFVSSCTIISLTLLGSPVILPVSGSRMDERFVVVV